MNQNNTETTLDDVLGAVNDFSTKVDERFDKVDERFDKIEGRLTRVEAQMVTKSYLDDKLADLKGDLIVLMRKEDTKLKALVDILAEKKVLTDEDKKRIFTMEPFPQLMG